MKYRVILLSFFLIIVLIPFSDAATFRDCDLSSSCGISALLGKNVEIYIKAQNPQSTSVEQELELIWSPSSGGNVIFEEGRQPILNAGLLPSETKIYKAVLFPSNTGIHRLNLTTDGSPTSYILVTVTPTPEFSEMGFIIPMVFIILSVIIYSVMVKNN